MKRHVHRHPKHPEQSPLRLLILNSVLEVFWRVFGGFGVFGRLGVSDGFGIFGRFDIPKDFLIWRLAEVIKDTTQHIRGTSWTRASYCRW
jgi:hypothetical protein